MATASLTATATLADYLSTAKHKGFKSAPRYFKHGDHLTYFVKEDRCHSMRVNELLTIYASVKDGSLVGCKVKGVKQVMENLKQMHILVCDEEVSIGLLFVSVAAITQEANTRDSVRDYAKQLPKTNVPKTELQLAA